MFSKGIIYKSSMNAGLILLAFMFLSCNVTDSNNNGDDPGDDSNQEPGSFLETNWLPDPGENRYFLPSGFVINMEEEILYKPEDFKRIAQYGSNMVVIRIGVGNLGGWPGYSLNQQYLEKLDAYVQFAKEAGLKTVFKMTIYDIRGANKVQNVWGKLFNNENNEQQYYLEAWQRLWTKYDNEPHVIGYDLINEPHKGENTNKTDVQVTKEQLVPLYKKLINNLHSVSSKKWAIYQPLKNSDRKPGQLAFAEFREVLNFDKLIYAPHAYYDNLPMLREAVNQYTEEANLSGAKMMMGEWGRQTNASADTTLEEQLEYFELYVHSADIYDRNNIGGIKAWFRGTPTFINANGRTFTWSIFRDETGVGTAERKFIVDAICRPKPLYTNAVVESYNFNFATRTLSIIFGARILDGESEIYVPERHYPDGFTVDIDNIRLVRDSQSEGGLTVVNGDPELVPSSFSYDEKNERLLITTWDNQLQQNELKIVPGIFK